MAQSEEIAVARELRERNDAELRSLLGDKREDLHKAKFKHSLGQLRETHLLKQYKRDIAVIETMLRERVPAPQSTSEEQR